MSSYSLIEGKGITTITCIDIIVLQLFQKMGVGNE